MSGSKHFDKIAWTVTAVILIITVLFMNGGALGLEVMAHTMGYENRLFDNTKVHTVDIVMENWDTFIAGAASEEYSAASVVIDGEAYKNVGIRGKGNTSLSTVSSMNSDRYSFKIEFDHYDSSISYHGLDKLSLNNLIQDSTMMKDYLTYTMMGEFGAAAPLCSFVYITVNGEDWGLYLAVEGVEDSFLERNYGSNYGELYKPDSMSFGGGRGNGKDFNMEDFMNQETDGSEQESFTPEMPGMDSFDPSQVPEAFGDAVPNIENFDPSQLQGDMPQMPETTQGETDIESGEAFSFGGKGGFGGMGSSDVKLQYVDENLSSYTNIWNNAKTDITEADQTRLIESLKKLSEGEALESVVDIEQVIRYFVVHNYVCNGDSYTGSMIHNYYLYEENGQLEMIPWDYNLAFGTFQGGNAQSTVNTPIDSPVSGGSGEDRPMWNWILSDESYTELYHQYFAEFLNTVDVQAMIDAAYELIKPYAEKDPTAFYTYDEFESGVEAMREFCRLRSESISMQLENNETVSDMGYVDASALMLSDMGSMGMGGGMPQMGEKPERFAAPEMPGCENSDTPNSETELSSAPTIQGMAFTASAQQTPQNGGMPEGFDPSQMQEGFGGQMPNMGEMPEGFDPSQIQGDFGGQMPNMGEMPEGFDPSQVPGGFAGQDPADAEQPSMVESSAAPSDDSTESADSTEAADSTEERGSMPSGAVQMPQRDLSINTVNGAAPSAQSSHAWIWLSVSVLVLAVGLVIAKLYKY